MPDLIVFFITRVIILALWWPPCAHSYIISTFKTLSFSLAWSSFYNESSKGNLPARSSFIGACTLTHLSTLQAPCLCSGGLSSLRKRDNKCWLAMSLSSRFFLYCRLAMVSEWSWECSWRSSPWSGHEHGDCLHGLRSFAVWGLR